MKLTFTIPDLDLEITVKGGSTRFFEMLSLMECILHYLRTRELEQIEYSSRGSSIGSHPQVSAPKFSL